MLTTMQDRQLTLQSLFRHGAAVYADSQVSAFDGQRVQSYSYAEIAARVARLANGLQRLGIRAGDRVGTFCWNTPEHLEAYFAVPMMGAVLHTLNVRLFADQLAYIVNHAEDRIIVVDATLAPVLAQAAPEFKSVERYVVVGPSQCGGATLPGECIDYESLLGSEPGDPEWPDLSESAAAVMCYTSGTTGNPKGVVYSHRSIYLHSLAINAANAVGLHQNDRVFVVPSMFHANAWGLPHAAWMTGCDLLFPGRFLQGASLGRLIAAERPTISAGVPTIWGDVLRCADAQGIDLSSLRLVFCGGSAVPRSMIEQFHNRHGVRMVQAWGMTETSPLMAMAIPPKNCPEQEELGYRAMTGRVLAGVELRVVNEGEAVPPDGESVGEIEARGPWVTAAYYGEDAAEKFRDGWLRTGDVGTLDRQGYVQIKDRTKDVIKSGGEWISSIDLENAIMGHADVLEAAVIEIPDSRWDERPLACVVLKPGAPVTPNDLRAFLEGRVVKWWIPERWVFLAEIPKTSVGKFDKKRLRAQQAHGEMETVETP